MASAQPNTVKDTGASYGDTLVGVEPHNLKLLVRIFQEQQAGEGGRLEGEVQLLEEGTGIYAAFIKPLLDREPMSVKEIVEIVRKDDDKATHFLNANTLRVQK